MDTLVKKITPHQAVTGLSAMSNETTENREQLAKILAALALPNNNTPPAKRSNLQQIAKQSLTKELPTEEPRNSTEVSHS